jgi:acetyl-CoA acetyltransferase
VDDVLDSTLISTPLHARDGCLVTDGGAAIVVTSAERARHLAGRSVYLRSFSESSNHREVSAMPDLTTTVASQTSRTALEMGGFCAKDEGGPFVAEGNIAPGGSLPLNTTARGCRSPTQACWVCSCWSKP